MVRSGFALLMGLLLAGFAPGQEPEPLEPMPCGQSCRPWLESFTSQGGDAADICGPVGRFWFSADYLMWFRNGDVLPPLVTTNNVGTPLAQAGILGLPGTPTQILFPAGEVNGDLAHGARLQAGGWFDRRQTFGMQFGYLQQATLATNFFASTDTNAILARPFINTTTGNNGDRVLVSFPGQLRGSILVSESQMFNGWDFAFRGLAFGDSNWRVDALFGYRRLRFSEKLSITSASVAQAGNTLGLVPGATTFGVDQFNTANDFYGLDLGFTGEYRCGKWTANVLVKTAFGKLNPSADINGVTINTVGANVAAFEGNLLALQTNIGNHTKSTGILVPEIGVNLAYDVTESIRLRAGYTFLYLPNFYRPGENIDTTVNSNLTAPTRNIGPGSPNLLLGNADVYLHAVNFGFELRY